MKNNMFAKAALAAAISFGFMSQGFAAGYEKSIMWGGRTGSVAGISTSYIMGADALYFNPAGLVKNAPGQDLSLNVSPVWSKFQGPYNNQNETAKSETGLSTPFGLIYSNTINDSWAFGVGGFISGGSKVKYEDVKFNAPFANSTADAETDLQIGEISAGVAYKINPMWKVGASYRYVTAKADFSFIQRAGATALVNVKLTDLEDQVSAFRLGGQWAPSESTHVGLTYRSEAKLAAKGNARTDGYVAPNGDPSANPALTGDRGEATANTVFPQAVTLGADHAFNEMWVGLAEIAWTNYAEVENITVTNTLLGNPVVNQDWKDQWNFRLGGEYKGFSWPIRFGYGFTSQVTNDDFARPTFTPPGASHTLTAGSGQDFELMGQKLAFNGAAEYTFVNGDANGTAAGTGGTGTDIRAGEHKTSSFALHLGLAYNF
jgi:long-chain fatty acid transport protein